jgi:putative PIG3 family NAD(P)H quinone oxidoreductase
MKAIVITGTGGADVLEVQDVPVPEPYGEQVRVRVRACGLNRADLMQCRGYYPAPPGAPADIPGLEYAGEVDAVGTSVTGLLKVGDPVFGIVGGGGQAEYVLTHERLAVKIPENLDFVQAAAVPEVFITAHDALEAQAETRPGESVLVHAVGSGVGTAAVQLARAMGCTVFGTSRTEEKLRQAAALGLDFGIDSTRDDFASVVLDQTGGAGVDVVLDLVGASVLEANIRALAVRGRVVVIGLLGGGTGTLPLYALALKRARLIATTLRQRPLEEKIAATQRFAARVAPWLKRGLVHPVVDSIFAFEAIREAQQRLESNLGFGKIVLRV